MMVITYIAFIILVLIGVAVQLWVKKVKTTPLIGNNPIFLQFQRSYFVAYLLATFADWLQGPYLYKLYQHYGFQEDQIAVLYVCGFASAVIFGTLAPIVADKYGRKKVCISFSVIYSIACLLKLSRNYWVLALGRILGGLATSVLFSSFETWYVHEHINTHDFPKEWIPVTFSKSMTWNAALAIVAGVVANVVAEWLQFGPVSPFIIAIPFLIVAGLFVSSNWDENYSQQPIKFSKSCGGALKEIVTEPVIFLIGIIQSLFESSMYIFIFLWTPVLDPAHASLGIAFSSFMVCIMIGSTVCDILRAHHVPTIYLLAMSVIMALLGYLLCILATHPDNPNRNLAFVAFLVIELSVGVYFSAMAKLKEIVFPESSQRGIMNWFRVPINIIACGILMTMHNQYNRQGNQMLFVACTALLAIASLCVIKFVSMFKSEHELLMHGGVEEEPLVAA